MVFTHNPADPDVAEAIRENPSIEEGACHFQVVLLTWHFDSFHLHQFPLRVSPLRFSENMKDFISQVLAEPRRIYGGVLKRQPALIVNNWRDGKHILIPQQASDI